MKANTISPNPIHPHVISHKFAQSVGMAINVITQTANNAVSENEKIINLGNHLHFLIKISLNSTPHKSEIKADKRNLPQQSNTGNLCTQAVG